MAEPTRSPVPDTDAEAADANATLAYAQVHRGGIAPAAIYRAIAIAGLFAVSGRLYRPLQSVLTGGISVLRMPSTGEPLIRWFLSVGIVLVSALSAILLLCTCIGLLNRRHHWARWLWVSEPCELLTIVSYYGVSFMVMIGQRGFYPASLLYLYPFGLVGSAAFPLLLIFLLRAVRAVEKADRSL